MTPKASSGSILQWICITLCISIKVVSSIDTLKQGEHLNSTSQLDSPNGRFTLRFYTPDPEGYPLTNNTYIAVVFNPGQSAAVKQVWIANRDDPVPKNSTPLLTLGTRGELTITRNGSDPIHLYRGSDTTSNITATLLDTGNFIVRSNGEVLWQSYDHPTDTLLSGMKLWANNKITSWLTPSNPAPGPFTLEWDPSPGELVIRRRGMAYWKSGRLVDYHDDELGNVKNFENFYQVPDALNFNYNLTSGGDYFMSTEIHIEGLLIGSPNTSGWLLDETGNITTTNDRGLTLTVVLASLCYGYNSGDDRYDKGCELWEQPKCLKRRQVVDLRSGYFQYANTTPVSPTIDSNASLSVSDCRDACWNRNDCECAGYANYIGQDYGCSYWIGGDLEWVQDNSGSTEKIYVLQSSQKGMFDNILTSHNSQ